MTQHYIGTKQILAEPMTRLEYNNFRGWELPANEAGMGDDPGYMVVYPDSPSNIDKAIGCVSWSPKAIFESAYLPMGEGADPSNVNEAMVDAFIVGHDVTRMGNHTVLLTRLRNGFTLVTDSACVDADNYDEATGTKYAMEKARAKVWELLGFLLATARNGLSEDARTTTHWVIVNGVRRDVAAVDGKVSYVSICAAAGYNPEHYPSVMYSSARTGADGILSPGGAAPITDDTIYNVAVTGDA